MSIQTGGRGTYIFLPKHCSSFYAFFMSWVWMSWVWRKTASSCECPGYDVKLHPAVTLNMSVGMLGCLLSQLPPHLQGYEAATTWVAELGSNHLRLMVWCSSYWGLADDPFLYKDNGKAHCPSAGTACMLRCRKRTELGCQLAQVIP